MPNQMGHYGSFSRFAHSVSGRIFSESLISGVVHPV